MSDSIEKYYEKLEEQSKKNEEIRDKLETDCQNVNAFLRSSVGDENFDFNRTNVSLMDEYTKYRESEDNPLNFSTKVKEAGEYITTSTINPDMSHTFTNEKKLKSIDETNKLLDAARNKGMLGDQVGAKYSDDKAPMGIMLRQFPLALQGVAQRSLYGHNKYKDFDHDWMNFKRVPDAINQYLNATVRHLAEIGDDEDSLEHLKAAAWNILATLQITLEKK